VFEQMPACGCKPDAVSYAILISAFDRGNQWCRALQVRNCQNWQFSNCAPIAKSGPAANIGSTAKSGSHVNTLKIQAGALRHLYYVACMLAKDGRLLRWKSPWFPGWFKKCGCQKCISQGERKCKMGCIVGCRRWMRCRRRATGRTWVFTTW
jgi:hypothetical protein